jgi:hypothetical protein
MFNQPPDHSRRFGVCFYDNASKDEIDQYKEKYVIWMKMLNIPATK